MAGGDDPPNVTVLAKVPPGVPSVHAEVILTEFVSRPATAMRLGNSIESGAEMGLPFRAQIQS
jgi:hypothetical protein